jgi:hypothetical protein
VTPYAHGVIDEVLPESGVKLEPFLVDTDLTGLLIGYTLLTKPEEVYRALLEATAFGLEAAAITAGFRGSVDHGGRRASYLFLLHRNDRANAGLGGDDRHRMPRYRQKH